MTKEQFERALRSNDKGVLIHLVCNEADEIFYSDSPEDMSCAHCTVLCVETFFATMCDGGFGAWFESDYCQLACKCSDSLRRVGLIEYADLADKAVRIHHEGEMPATVAEWDPHLTRIRGLHTEEDHSEKYCPLDTEFFELCHDDKCHFRGLVFDFIVKHEEDLVKQPVGAL